MPAYDETRTEETIARLVAAGNQVLSVTVTISVAVFSVLTTLLSLLVLAPDLWWLGAILGGLVGYGIGRLLASLYATVLEWMAQMLITQEEILNQLRKS